MNKFAMAVVAATSLLLAACGGASTGTLAGAGTGDLVTVQGKLESRDGATTALAGVVVTCVESGERDVTDAQGAFQLHAPMHQRFHLDFEDPAWSTDAHSHGDHGEFHDPHPDEVEADGPGVTMHPAGTEESCDVEVHLDEGDVTECYVRWTHGDERIREGERHLDRDPLCDEVDAMGEIEISLQDGCLAVEIEVDGFSGAASLDIYIEDPSGAQAYVATMEIDSAGAGHLDWSWCAGEPLPFDATAPEDLAGYGVVVYDEAGAVVFRSHLPHEHANHMGDSHHGGDPMDDGQHHGGGMGGGPPHGP